MVQMTSKGLSARHPNLFHLAPAGAATSIIDRGLLATRDILELWDVPVEQKVAIMTQRRPRPVTLEHSRHGRITISDNAPLSEKKLSRVLDDGLSPSQWFEMLNSRVFFFASFDKLARLQRAQANRAMSKDILVIDTQRLAESYGAAMEIVPFNSGNTNHNAVRRGEATFAPLLSTDYQVWRRRRGKASPDTIKEVTVRGSVLDIRRFVTNVRPGGSSQ